MEKEQEKNANKMYDEFTKNATPEDVQDINENLDSMNRGPLAEIWDKVQQLWSIVKNPKVPFIEKMPAIGALVYTISPIDAIPDAIPGLGLIDDALVITLAIAGLGHLLVKYADILTDEIIDEK